MDLFGGIISGLVSLACMVGGPYLAFTTDGLGSLEKLMAWLFWTIPLLTAIVCFRRHIKRKRYYIDL